jgi:hypothetical protein
MKICCRGLAANVPEKGTPRQKPGSVGPAEVPVASDRSGLELCDPRLRLHNFFLRWNLRRKISHVVPLPSMFCIASGIAKISRSESLQARH